MLIWENYYFCLLTNLYDFSPHQPKYENATQWFLLSFSIQNKAKYRQILKNSLDGLGCDWYSQLLMQTLTI